MNRTAIIWLIAGIIMIGLFMESWLVFNNIRIVDWIVLALGAVNVACFGLSLKMAN